MKEERERGDDVGDRLLDLTEVARVLGVCKRTVHRLVASGELPRPVKVGRGARLYLSDVRGYLSGLREQYRRA